MDSSTPAREALGGLRGAALLALFLSSGATSLVYQILWVRELSLALGSTVYAISIVVSAFMGGLALGSAFFGRRAEAAPSGLALYAWLEGGIGVCAVILPWAFGGILGLAASLPGDSWLATPLPFAASFAALLVPTTLMGGTLPLLSRYVSAYDTARGMSIGLLYSLNTVGALLGAALTGFVLVRMLGIQTTTHVAAGANFAICVAGLALARLWPQRALPATPEAPAATASDDAGLRGPVIAVYCVNGLAGLALQLLWTRAFALLGTNTTYAFTIIVTTYLLGLALGSGLLSSLLPRLGQPVAWLALLQTLTGLVAALTPLCLATFGLDVVEGFAPVGGLVLSSGLLAALLMLPATLLMGACFPLVAQVVAGGGQGVGSRVGHAYALNTLGGVAGSLLAGFALLPSLGIERSILLCAALLSSSGLYLALRSHARVGQAVGAATVLLCTTLALFASDHFQGMLEVRLGHPLRFYREGVETTVGVYDSERAGRPVLVINNVALADTGVVHKLLAHLPALLQESPERALVLGFGVGISSESLSTHGLAVNDCVEISPGVVEAAPYFASLNGNIVDRGDENFRLFVTDGRKLLLSPGDPYDIIVLDANSGNIRNAGVGKLYTREFFELARRRLSPDGIISLYIPLDSTTFEYEMVVRTFQEVFPHAALFMDRAFGDTSVLLGSIEPLRVDVPRYLERILSPRVQADLAPLRLDEPGLLLSSFLMGEELLRVFAAAGAINSDDHPILEFFALGGSPFEENDRALSDIGFWLHHDSVLPLLDAADGHPRGRALRRFLVLDERASYSLFESWVHECWGDVAGQRAAWARAAALHPQAEYLRAGAGHGRAALRQAERRAAGSQDVWQLGHAGFLALSRGNYERAARYYSEALALVPNTTSPGVPRERIASLHFGMARSTRALGRHDEASRHLREAAGRNVTSDLEYAELQLARAPAGTRPDLTRSVANAALPAGDLARAREAYAALDDRDQVDPVDLQRYAWVLERLGDPAGAHATYERALASNPRVPGGATGLARTALLLGLRAGVLEQAFHAGDPRRSTRSVYLALPTRRTRPPALDPREPAPWLELSRLYLRARQPILAYRMARAARTAAPDDPESYVAVGVAAEQLPFPGTRELATTAYERALEIDPEYAPARRALSGRGF
jgi:spermidine synthase